MDVKKGDKEFWKDKLSQEQYDVCFLGNTEKPFTGEYWDHHEQGVYKCVACQTPLFSSTTKYDSGSGWPSFYEAMDDKTIERKDDFSHGMVRTEIVCSNCSAHLGHVFNDGPKPSGERFCVNSTSLKFDPDAKSEEKSDEQT